MRRTPLLLFFLFFSSYARAEGPPLQPLLGGPLLLSLGLWGTSTQVSGAWFRLRVPLSLENVPEVPYSPTPQRESSPPPKVAPVRLRKLLRAAWRNAGLEDQEQERLATRARQSALLPEVRLRGMKSNDQMLRYMPLNEEDLRAQSTGQAGMLYEIRLDFRLGQLIFSDEEVAIARLKQEREQQRQRITQRLTELLTLWHKSVARASVPGLSEEEQVEADSTVVAAEAALDLLTDGTWTATAESR